MITVGTFMFNHRYICVETTGISDVVGITEMLYRWFVHHVLVFVRITMNKHQRFG